MRTKGAPPRSQAIRAPARSSRWQRHLLVAEWLSRATAAANDEHARPDRRARGATAGTNCYAVVPSALLCRQSQLGDGKGRLRRPRGRAVRQRPRLAAGMPGDDRGGQLGALGGDPACALKTTTLRIAFGIRRDPLQVAAILPRRKPEPALAGSEETALFGEAEQVCRLRQREVEPVEVLLGQLAAGVVQELHEGRRFLFEAPLQRALAHAKLARDLVASRLAVGQAADDHLAHAVAGLAAVEMLEIVAGIAVVERGQRRVGRGQWPGQIVECIEQAAETGAERNRAAERGAVGRKIAGGGIGQGDLHRAEIASAHPAAEGRHSGENELHPLSRHRPFAATELERHAVAAALFAPVDGQRIAQDAQVTHQALEGVLQIRARHHRVAHDVEAGGPHHLGLREPEGWVARTLDRHLPEAADLLGGDPRARGLQGRRIDPGSGEQRDRVQALFGEHLGGRPHPDGRRGLRDHSWLRQPGWISEAIRLAGSVNDMPPPKIAVYLPCEGGCEMPNQNWLASYGERIPAVIDPGVHRSVVEVLEGAIQRYAERPAFHCFGQTLTYADTDRLSRAFAAYLQGKLGVAKGDRVAVMMPNIPAFPL